MRALLDNKPALVEHVECTLGPTIRSLSVEEEFWSASGMLHLAGVWRAAATPVHIKFAAVCQFERCHGDVHMCNVLTRTPLPAKGNTLRIDCQPIIQPRAFDAAYP